MNTKSEILNKEFDFKVHHTGLNFDSDFFIKDSYRVSINNESFDYFQGIGHRIEINRFHRVEAKKWLNFRAHKDNQSYSYLLSELNKHTKPKALNIDDILFCLVIDAYCGSLSFSEFCDNYGYDNDSLKVLNIYLDCEKTKDRLNRLGIDIDAANELFSDY